MTPGQRLILKVQSDLDWAVTMLNASSTPEALDTDRLVADVRTAITTRLSERCAPPVDLADELEACQHHRGHPAGKCYHVGASLLARVCVALRGKENSDG